MSGLNWCEGAVVGGASDAGKVWATWAWRGSSFVMGDGTGRERVVCSSTTARPAPTAFRFTDLPGPTSHGLTVTFRAIPEWWPRPTTVWFTDPPAPPTSPWFTDLPTGGARCRTTFHGTYATIHHARRLNVSARQNPATETEIPLRDKPFPYDNPPWQASKWVSRPK